MTRHAVMTQEQIARASELWIEGRTCRFIADAIGMWSPSCVSSLAHRRRDLFPYRGSSPEARPVHLATPPSNVDGYTPYDEASHRKPLMNLEPGECKWPVGRDHRGHLFCGHEAKGSYCDHHKKRSVGSGTHSEQSAVRDARKVTR